jgi:hypothetical protein
VFAIITCQRPSIPFDCLSIRHFNLIRSVPSMLNTATNISYKKRRKEGIGGRGVGVGMGNKK